MTSLPSDQAPPESSARTFAEEVRAHDPLLKAYLRKTFPDIRDVEDVAQESYLRAWKAYAGQPIRSAKALFFLVARRLALNLIRREKRSPIISVTDFEGLCVLEDRPDAAAAAMTEQEIELLAEAVDSLPSRCREIFILRRLQNVPQKEIATRLGISEQTVQVQAARGLRRCQEYLARRIEGK